MRYHVLYLAAGDLEATYVEAPDAATAVAIVDHMQCARAFELLRVTPTPDDPGTDQGGVDAN